jgi:flagellar basal body-associated protein FliL
MSDALTEGYYRQEQANERFRKEGREQVKQKIMEQINSGNNLLEIVVAITNICGEGN